jgi:N-acetylneuraminic acid mutarotase
MLLSKNARRESMERTAKTLVLMLLLFAILDLSIIASKPAFGTAVTDDSWTSVSSVPTNANASMGIIPTFGNIWAAALNGELFCFGGINQHEKAGSYVWYGINEKYSTDTGNWNTITRPVNNGGAVVVCHNKLYSIGTKTQVYDLSTNTWSNKTSMPQSLVEVKANLVEDKIYVISGAKYATLGGTAISDVTYRYDPESDSWSTMASIPTPVEGYASAVLDGKIYIIGGAAISRSYSNQVVNLVQIFNPKTNQWTVGKPLPTGVYAAGACATSGLFAPERICVVGGNAWYLSWQTSGDLNPHGTTLNQIYNPATGNWSFGASLPEPRWRCSLVNINDTLFVVGGENGPADDALFDNPEKVVLEIDKYVTSSEANSLLSPSSTLITPSNVDVISSLFSYLLVTATIVILVIIVSGLFFRRQRKTA